MKNNSAPQMFLGLGEHELKIFMHSTCMAWNSIIVDISRLGKQWTINVTCHNLHIHDAFTSFSESFPFTLPCHDCNEKSLAHNELLDKFLQKMWSHISLLLLPLFSPSNNAIHNNVQLFTHRMRATTDQQIETFTSRHI